jgi:hypothetical protein
MLNVHRKPCSDGRTVLQPRRYHRCLIVVLLCNQSKLQVGSFDRFTMQRRGSLIELMASTIRIELMVDLPQDSVAGRIDSIEDLA